MKFYISYMYMFSICVKLQHESYTILTNLTFIGLKNLYILLTKYSFYSPIYHPKKSDYSILTLKT